MNYESTVMNYESTANALADRIVALIPSHPEILTLDSAWALFKIPGFDCSDIGPTLFQAQWALSVAKARHQKREQP